MPNEERTGLLESEQRPKLASFNSSDPSRREAIIGLVTPTEERAEATINDQYPQYTPSTLHHQGPEEAVESKGTAVTSTTKKTIGSRTDLSDAVHSITPPLEGQREPVGNKELCGGNSTNDTTVTAVETVRGPALLFEESKFPSPSDKEDADNAVGNTTSEKLLDGLQVTPDDQKQQSRPRGVLHEKNVNKDSSRITMESAKSPHKAPETQDQLASGSEMQSTKKHPQVSNIICPVAIFVV